MIIAKLFQSTQPLLLKRNKPIQNIALLVSALPILAASAQTLELDRHKLAAAPLSSEAGHQKKSVQEPDLSPDLEEDKSLPTGLWSFGFSAGFISDNAPIDYLTADFARVEGPGKGTVYNFTVARQIKEFDWTVGNTHLRPQLEVPFRFTLVDEKAEGLIPDFNLGLVGRWQDFPWNRFVYTTISSGLGFSYSSPVWTADKQRHVGEDRSELKFWLPMEITFALPRYPNYQLTAFADHQSGGWIFDIGGVDSWGLGLRIVF